MRGKFQVETGRQMRKCGTVERWYADNGKVIYWLTAYMVYGDMDCGVCKDEKDKKEPTTVSKSCYKPIKERG